MFQEASSSLSVPRGPRGTRHLSIEDVRRIEQFSRVAQNLNLDLNWMLTVRVPADLCNAQGKRHVHNITRTLFQALRRRGDPAIAATIYERRWRTRDLHAHVLVHIPTRSTDLIEQRQDPPDLHVRQTNDKAVAYVTKERWARPSGPGYFYERADYIPGLRVSFTKEASALLRGEVLSVSNSPPSDASRPRAGRMSPAVLRATRTRHGLTQKTFYGLIGVSRSHGANVEAGRCRLSRPATQKALRIMQELGRSRPQNRKDHSLAA